MVLTKKKKKKKCCWVPTSCFSHGNIYFKVLPNYAECHLWCLRLTWRLQWTSLLSLNEWTASSQAPSWPHVDPRWSFPFKPQNRHSKIVVDAAASSGSGHRTGVLVIFKFRRDTSVELNGPPPENKARLYITSVEEANYIILILMFLAF